MNETQAESGDRSINAAQCFDVGFKSVSGNTFIVTTQPRIDTDAH